MEYEAFIKEVQCRAHVRPNEAEKAIRATLEVLAQRLFWNEADHLAHELPSEVKSLLHQIKIKEKFDLNEFYRRVSEREGVEIPVAVRHARAVASVIQDSISPGEMEEVLSQLPEEYYNDLFRAKVK